MTLRVKLLSMPFGDMYRPSVGLAQLKSATENAFGEKVSIDVHYLTLEFAHIIGPKYYYLVSSDTAVYVSGFGDWLFRKDAFPEEDDNADAYFARYGVHLGRERVHTLNERLMPVRQKLDQFMDGMIEKYEIDQADIVGFTSLFSQNMASIAMARRVKLANSRIITTMGGANCDGTMGIELINNSSVLDFVFSGHSLISFPKFVGLVLDGDMDSCHKLDGVFSRKNSISIDNYIVPDQKIEWGKHRAESQLKGVKERAEELDVDTVLALDYDGYLDAFYELLPDAEHRPAIPFETSRGCWWGERAHCTFCGLNGSTMAYRAMSPERALPFIRNLVARYSDRVTNFECADNIMPKEYIRGVFGNLKVPEGVSIFYEVKSDMSDADLEVISTGGVTAIQPGIESLSTSTLKLMRKGTTAFNNIKFLAGCLIHGITPTWNLLVGFPGEAASIYEAYMRVLPRLFHLPPPNGALPVRFDRFSPYFVDAKEYGLNLEAYEHYSLCFPFSKNAIANMAYYFQDKNYDAQYIRDLSSALAELRELVFRWQRRWWSGSGATRPKLELTRGAGGSLWIEDSRSGAAKRMPLSSAAFDLLTEVLNPVDEGRIRRDFGRVFDEVNRMGLVFNERGRVMNIVPGLNRLRVDMPAAGEGEEVRQAV